MGSPSPEYWMGRAIALSRRGLPAPNPHVGCILVTQEDVVVGEGWHPFAGGPHAEAMALAQARERARGAEAFVTLEPCNHHGRQPPCTAALVRAGIRKVWIACLDPNPNVLGGGAAALSAAGIEVVTDFLSDRAERENRPWMQAMRRRRPFVTVKTAMSLDGRIALPSGESQWITGERARKVGRRLRAEMGAVLVGRGTVESDNPQLTARIQGHPNEPVRIVLDPRRKLASDYAVFAQRGTCLRVVDPTFAGPGDLVVPTVNESLDWNRLLSELWSQGLTGVLIEGGAKTVSSVLDSGQANRLELFAGNVALGAGPAWYDSPVLGGLADKVRWRLEFVRKLDQDVWMRFEAQDS